MSYKRKQKEKRRYQKLFNDSKDAGYPCPVWPRNKPNKDTYFKRYWKSQGVNSSWAWNKRQAHRTTRRKYNQNIGDKTSYNKMIDLWWNVY